MRIYTFSEARQNFSELLNLARNEGEVLIRRQDGSRYIVRPFKDVYSPLDIEGINVDLGRKEIIEAVKGTREDRF